jgi:hypothetical protein
MAETEQQLLSSYASEMWPEGSAAYDGDLPVAVSDELPEAAVVPAVEDEHGLGVIVCADDEQAVAAAKLARRKERNRESAKQSRKRQKDHADSLEDEKRRLEETVRRLTSDNQALRADIARLTGVSPPEAPAPAPAPPEYVVPAVVESLPVLAKPMSCNISPTPEAAALEPLAEIVHDTLDPAAALEPAMALEPALEPVMSKFGFKMAKYGLEPQAPLSPSSGNAMLACVTDDVFALD